MAGAGTTLLDSFPLLRAQSEQLAERATRGETVHVADGMARSHLLEGAATALGARAVFVRVPEHIDRCPYTVLSIATQCGPDALAEVADQIRRYPAQVDPALEALSRALDGRVLVVDDADRIEPRAGDELLEVRRADAVAIHAWVIEHAKLTGGAARRALGSVPELGEPSAELAELWARVAGDARSFQLALAHRLVLADAPDTVAAHDLVEAVWEALSRDLRDVIQLLAALDRWVDRPLFERASGSRPDAVDALASIGIAHLHGGRVTLADEWRDRAMVALTLGADPLVRRRFAGGLEREALEHPSPIAVLEAHRQLAAIGELERAARVADYGVLSLLDLARTESLRRRYPTAVRVYQTVLDLDAQLRASTDVSGIGARARAYAIHYRAYNRYKAGADGSPLETLAAYREALASWPEQALFWSRTISCCFVAGRYEEALRARAQAFASVPRHSNRSTLLIQRTVEHLLERDLVLPALLTWDDHRPETIPQRHVGERLFEKLAAGWACDELWAPTTGAIRFTPSADVHLRREGDGYRCVLFGLEPPDAPRPSEAVANAVRHVRTEAIAALECETEVDWLAILDPSPAPDDEDAAWLGALLRLRARRREGTMMAAQHRMILEVLRRMRGAAPSIRRPLLAPTDAGAYQLVWSYRDRSAALEVEVQADGSLEWLFLDRADGSSEGSEVPEPRLPDRAVSFASRLA